VGWKEEDKEAAKETGEKAEEGGGEEAGEETLKEERRKAVVDMEGRTERKLPLSCCRSHIEPRPALPRARTIRKGVKRYEARQVVVAAVVTGRVGGVGTTGAVASDMMKGRHLYAGGLGKAVQGASRYNVFRLVYQYLSVCLAVP
jgi:hypothetical protein